MKRVLNKALETALKAGEAIMEIYDNEDFDVEMKTDKSPLTKADKKAHKVIEKKLNSFEYPVLSEEGKQLDYLLRKKWDYFWLVDPLDGTKEFINRNGEFTVNIALIRGQTPVAGVIYVPVSGELYLGIPGAGAWKLEQKPPGEENLYEFIISSGKSLNVNSKTVGEIIAVGSRSHMNDETQAYIDKLKSAYGNVKIMSRGSSLKLCMVAEGKAHVYPRFAPTMEWDTAAGHAVARAAGAVVLDVENGTEVIYNKENLLNPWFLVKPSDSSF